MLPLFFATVVIRNEKRRNIVECTVHPKRTLKSDVGPHPKTNLKKVDTSFLTTRVRLVIIQTAFFPSNVEVALLPAYPVS